MDTRINTEFEYMRKVEDIKDVLKDIKTGTLEIIFMQSRDELVRRLNLKDGPGNIR